MVALQLYLCCSARDLGHSNRPGHCSTNVVNRHGEDPDLRAECELTIGKLRRDAWPSQHWRHFSGSARSTIAKTL